MRFFSSFVLPCVTLVFCVVVDTTRAEDLLTGKRVVVIKDNAPLAVSGKPAGTVAECSVFTVTKVELDIALGDMNDAIRLNSNESAWFINRGLLWNDKQNYDQAIADYGEAIRLDPKNGTAYHNRGNAWRSKKEYDNAITDYGQALTLQDPNEKLGVLFKTETTGGDSVAMVSSRASTLSNRGLVWEAKREYDKALADYEEAIRLDPKFVLPRANRRQIYKKKGEWDKVAAEWEAEVKEGSPTARTYNALAWLRATCSVEKHRNGQQAVKYATKACELTAWKNPRYLDSLAAAHAEVGDFDKAVEWQKNGMDLAPADEKADYESRLKLYLDKNPYRQPVPQ
jgi:tetratricopeptide (TPR) repeat protein